MSKPTGLSLSDLARNYHAYALSEGRPIMAAFSDPTAYPRARVVTLAGLPAAFGIIELAERELRQADPHAGWDDRKKKFLGYCTLLFMRKHGHSPARIKRRMPHPAFTKGEVYEIADYQPLPHARVTPRLQPHGDDAEASGAAARP